MSELVPSGNPPGNPPATALERLKSAAAQPAARRVLPWFAGAAALGVTALAWGTLSPSPQRTLYAELGDSERAGVVDALDKAAIAYSIDNQTGALSVDETDFYRARMLVAADGALASPQSGAQMLDSLPMGASRTLEGERLRAARERELTLTIMEIDGVEAVRVHLAESEKSVFVRDDVPPTASVMVRLARGRQLSESQVVAVVNLVAASVPGLSPDQVRVADQHGRLISDRAGTDADRLELQARMEEKLRGQIAQLLTPMLGQGNFSSEIQVELDMSQITSASERYDKDGVVRSETEAKSQTVASAAAVGVPGVLSNTPPPAATAVAQPPQGTPAASGTGQQNGESSSTRTYELGREVSVANSAPGGIKRLSVAVALSAAAMKGGKAGDIGQIEQLVSAAVGANVQRGDQVKVMARAFKPDEAVAPAFYEASWFAMVVRNLVALLALILVLFMGVRPLVKVLRRDSAPPPTDTDEQKTDGDNITRAPHDAALLNEKVGLAQRLIAEKPDQAVAVLRQMLAQPAEARS